MPLDTLPQSIQLCILRIRALLADEIKGAGCQVICQRPGDRVNLALTVDDKPIAFNFISEDECQVAYERDPDACSSIDHFTRNWIQVARVKLKDNRSISEFSHQALSIAAHARAHRQLA
jgi:hypothetical protein